MPRKYRYRGGQSSMSPLPLILSKPIDALGSSESAISLGNSQVNESIQNKQLMGGSSSITVPSFPSPPGGSISPYNSNTMSQMVNTQLMQANENAKNDFYAYQQGGLRLRTKKRKTNKHRRNGKKNTRKSLSRRYRKKSRRFNKIAGNPKRKHLDNDDSLISSRKKTQRVTFAPRRGLRNGYQIREDLIALDREASQILVNIQDTIDHGEDDESYERAQQALSDINNLISVRLEAVISEIESNYRDNDKRFFFHLKDQIRGFNGEQLAHLERALLRLQEDAIPESMEYLSYILQSPEARAVSDRINWQENYRRLVEYVNSR